MPLTRAAIRCFARDDGGTVALLFAMCIIVVVFALGAAIDFGRATAVASKFGGALDATTLATARAMSEQELSESEVTAFAKNFLDAQLESANLDSVTVNAISVEADPNTGSVRMSVDADVATTFSRVLNHDKIPIGRSSRAAFKLKNVELAMVLDVTGSMCNPCSKIAGLKSAAKEVVDVLLPNGQSTQNRIALVPYSATVNAGSYAAAVTNGAAVDTCTFEREGQKAYSDDGPGPGDYLGVESDPSDPANNHYVCPPATVLPLSTTNAVLKATIDSYGASGWTAGHLGAAWGWYMLSPNWNGVWPGSIQAKEYNDPNTVKAVLFMTDGAFNTSYKNGPKNATSVDQTSALCANMKSKGIVIYSVAFVAPAAGEAILQECASKPAYYFDAESTTELQTAFKSIAESLQRLRLTE